MKEIKEKFEKLREIKPNKSLKKAVENDIMKEFFSGINNSNVWTNDSIHTIVDTNDTTAYSDLTGRLCRI